MNRSIATTAIAPHGTRHSFASIALDEGVQLTVLRDVLGHESEAFTADFYTQVFPARMREAMERVSGALSALLPASILSLPGEL